MVQACHWLFIWYMPVTDCAYGTCLSLTVHTVETFQWLLYTVNNSQWMCTVNECHWLLHKVQACHWLCIWYRPVTDCVQCMHVIDCTYSTCMSLNIANSTGLSLTVHMVHSWDWLLYTREACQWLCTVQACHWMYIIYMHITYCSIKCRFFHWMCIWYRGVTDRCIWY